MDQESGIVHRNTQTDMMVARQAQEVQVAMLAAKKFPRDQLAAMDRIKATCQRPTLADQAIYTYPRGDKNVSGPTIRLAEAIAQNWGNIDFGMTELERREGASEVMAYAWDLETNTRSVMTFTVRHKRDTKEGVKVLTDERDIYEMIANQGARRKRACIMNVIPGDVTEMATAECRKTAVSSDKRTVKEIADDVIKVFKTIGVSKQQLEKYMGKQLSVLLKEDLLDLKGIYKAIYEKQTKVEDYFKPDDETVKERIRTAEAKRDEMNDKKFTPKAVKKPKVQAPEAAVVTPGDTTEVSDEELDSISDGLELPEDELPQE